MFKMKKLLQRIARPTKQQLMIGGAFAIALAASVGLGLHTRAQGSAAIIRECDNNAINNQNWNGGCGAANGAELVADVRNNKPGDLNAIYSHFGLTPDKYDRFAREAVQGTLFRDGHVEVNGQTVMTNVTTMGRQSFGNPNRKPYPINGVTYYHAAPSTSFGPNTQSLPVMVMFGANGAVEVIIMNSCGNPLPTGTKITPKLTCDGLQATQPDKVKKPNTYQFSAKATLGPNTTLSRVVYTFSDGRAPETRTSLTDTVEHTLTKDTAVKVTVYAKVPGGKEIQATSIECEKLIKYVPPVYVCTALVPATIDQQKRSFRFTVKVSHDPTTSLKDVDFTLDDKDTTTGVTTKDGDGNVYKEYTFTDAKEHTVKVKVNFNTVEGVKSDTGNCKSSVTPKEEPKCEVPGKQHLPPNHPDCGYCKPGIPKGDDRCKVESATTLVKTGPASTLGLFAGTSILGALGHRFYLKRRMSRSA